jgi:DNA modification methylase
MITAGELTAAHGRELLRLQTHGEQEKMAKRVLDFGLNVKRTQVKVSKYNAKKKKADKAPPDRTIPQTDVPGVYFKDSSNMSELPNNSVQLIVSSPPYNVGKEFEQGVPHDVHLHEIQAVIKEAARVLAPGCIMALNVADIWNFKGVKGQNDFNQVQLMGHKYQSMLRKHHIYLTDVVIWVKNTSWRKMPRLFYSDETVHTTYGMLEHFEPVYLFRKSGEREIPPEDVVLRSRLTKEEWVSWVPAVWHINAVRDMSEHPSIYPDELVMRLVKMFSYEGDTVLDPWLGSGTTVKVARELGRNGIGYERDLRYKSLIMKKLGVAAVEPEKKPGPMVEYFTNAMSRSDDPDTIDIEELIEKETDREADGETFDLEDVSEEDDLVTV